LSGGAVESLLQVDDGLVALASEHPEQVLGLAEIVFDHEHARRDARAHGFLRRLA
jgi:hypothetical protein